MAEIVIEGGGFRLLRAEPSDLEYILELQRDEENAPFILPFERERWIEILDGRAQPKLAMIIESGDGDRCGYLLLDHFDEVSMYLWHLVVGRGHKGRGVGHGALRLLKRLVFDVFEWHRLWIDCETTNERALRLYDSEGFRREGLFRESVCIGGEYKDLVIFAMLRREYGEASL